MARIFTLDAPEAAAPGRKAHHVVCADASEYHAYVTSHRHEESTDAPRNWFGNVTRAQALAATAHGDNACAAASDAMLTEIETALDMPTPRTVTRLDVAGGIPCVPAHLAGAPMAMRRRVRTMDEAAPLGIVVDVVCSGSISTRDMMKRGAAIVALVRLLCARRPVECWALAGSGAQGRTNGVFQWVKIDTAPLDLARAAFILGHIGFARRITYATAKGEFGFDGGWPFGARLSPKGYSGIVAQALPHLGDSLLIPAPHIDDASITDPLAWIKEHLATYAPD
jgi:hypothetical protein